MALIDNLINQSQPSYLDALNPNSKITKWLVNSHTCSVCGKSFPSYQALGGHKSSHRSKSDEKQVRVFEPINGRIHECKICGKAFATGQALGGHKRKHFKGVIGSNTKTSRDDKSGVTFDAVRVFDFDLNVSPPLEEEYEEVESSQPPPLMLFR